MQLPASLLGVKLPQVFENLLYLYIIADRKSSLQNSISKIFKVETGTAKLVQNCVISFIDCETTVDVQEDLPRLARHAPWSCSCLVYHILGLSLCLILTCASF